MPVQKLTKEQAAIIGAYTGYTCGPFADIQGYVEKLLGRLVWTHELGNKAMADHVREKAKPDFLALCYDEESTHKKEDQ